MELDHIHNIDMVHNMIINDFKTKLSRFLRSSNTMGDDDV